MVEREIRIMDEKENWVTTASGFKTRNACADVTAQTIETWFKHDFSKVNGDIEECLNIARNPADQQAERRRACTEGTAPESREGGSSARDEMMKRLNGVRDSQKPEDYSNADIAAMGDIHPPKV